MHLLVLYPWYMFSSCVYTFISGMLQIPIITGYYRAFLCIFRTFQDFYGMLQGSWGSPDLSRIILFQVGILPLP